MCGGRYLLLSMKILITENQLEKVIFNYIDKYVGYIKFGKGKKSDSIFYYYRPSKSSDNVELMRYNPFNQSLVMNYRVLKHLIDFFGMKGSVMNQYIKKWYENKFKKMVLSIF